MKHMLLFALCILLAVAAETAVTRTFTIKEPVNLAWGPDRVNYAVNFPAGEVAPQGVSVKDAAGTALPAQLTGITLWPDGRTVKSATLSFMASLKPDETGVWMLTAGKDPVAQPASDLAVKESENAVELSTGKVGIRLPSGAKTFPAAVAAEQVPAPIQAVRLSDGRWIGKGWWATDRPCLGYSAKVLEKGPVFARVALRYDFTDNTRYSAVVELSAGQDVAVISEEFNLSDGKRYEMPELGGVKPGSTFAYVKPHFASETQAMIWDWWGQTHGRVPSPNCYNFSFYQGLQPDSAEWSGRLFHEAIKEGDGGMKYEKDGRVISINAYLQWGEDETLYFGAYKAGQGTDEVAIIGLRPGRWVHPDIDPHPASTLHQYTQTNNMWIEQRKSPDLYLRVPTCLGKRVYGIGVLQRHAQAGADGKQTVASDIMLRHVRLGRLELDTLKDWKLDYPETSKYPRLFVDAGDLERMRKRAQKNIPDLQYITWVRYLNDGNPATGQKLITECIDTLKKMAQSYATTDFGHMTYAIETGVHAHRVDIALAVPEITPEQRATILRLVALNLYNSLSPDYVPPREAGFAWGSANMMAQLRSRGALMAALLPNQPEGKKLRNELAQWLTADLESQVNQAGCTLECPGYGSMAIELGVVPLLAMSNCGDVDMTAAIARYRAAAHERLATLLPWDLRGNYRSVPTIGNTYYMSDGTLAQMAAFLEKTDPELAKELWWGINESGRSFGGHPTPTGVLLDPEHEAVQPKLGSEAFTGLGFVMRNGFPRHDETFILGSAGSFEIGHGFNPGSFILYAKGAPLMVDFASMYTPYFGEQWAHSGGISFNHDETVKPCPGRDAPGCYYTGKVWVPHTVEPFTSLEPGWDPQAKDLDEAFGKVTAFATLPAADYAEMARPIRYLTRMPYMLPDTHQRLVVEGQVEDVWIKAPFTNTRRFVFVKSPDPLGHNYIVFRDDLAGNTELNPALNLWCLADKLEVNGQTAIYTGQHGVDLDCYVAEPSTFTYRTHRVGHTSGFGFSQYYQKTFGKPFEEYQLLFQIPQAPGKGGYFVALVPRKHDEAAPKFATLPGGNAIQAIFPDRTDTVVLLNQPGQVKLEGLTLQGTAFLLTKEKKKLTVTMLAPGTVKKGRKVLLSGDKAKTVEVK